MYNGESDIGTKTLSESIRDLRYELSELQKVKFEIHGYELEMDQLISQLSGRTTKGGSALLPPILN